MALAKRRENKNLVRFVERWGELGVPTPAARLAQARALVELRLLDRATIRLKELAALEPCRTEALTLLGKTYVLRGWPNEALPVLEEARSRGGAHAELEALLLAAAAPPLEPKDPADEESDPERLCQAAEAFLAAGSFLKAQRLLERSRRVRPNNPRAIELLWALGGDYSCTDALDDLVRRWGPDLTLPEASDDPEHTESVTMSGVPALAFDAPEPSDLRSFPSLFRSAAPLAAGVGLEPTEGADATDDLTQSSSMADLRVLVDSANPDGPTSIEDADDTQIVRVLHNDHGAEDTGVIDAGSLRAAAFAPRIGDLPDLAPSGPVLRAPNGKAASDFDPGLEEEDDDLIILTRRPASANREADTGPALDPDPTTSDVAGRVADILELVRQEQRTASAITPPPAAPPAVDHPKDRPRRRRRVPTGGAGLWLIVLGVVLGLAGVSVLGLAALKLAIG